jgi:hypothetical protein
MKPQQTQMNYLGAVFAMKMPVYVVMDVTMICIASDVLGEMFIDYIYSVYLPYT